MQVLSPDLCRPLSWRCINIHHSFLPSFKGAKPYHQAHAARRQDHRRDRPLCDRRPRRRPDHRAGGGARRPSRHPRDLVAMGRDIENVVLSRALSTMRSIGSCPTTARRWCSADERRTIGRRKPVQRGHHHRQAVSTNGQACEALAPLSPSLEGV